MSQSTLRLPDSEDERKLHRVGARLAGLDAAEFALPAHHHAGLHGVRFRDLD
jgi:hypothetical protein